MTIEPITLTPVISSNVAAWGHDPIAEILAVKFNGSDAVHHYLGVPVETVAEMREAKSIGSFFAKSIRPLFTHVPPPPPAA